MSESRLVLIDLNSVWLLREKEGDTVRADLVEFEQNVTAKAHCAEALAALEALNVWIQAGEEAELRQAKTFVRKLRLRFTERNDELLDSEAQT